MSRSDTSIANAALTKVGAATISSLQEDVKGARILRDRFDEVRDRELELNVWRFAVTRVQLAADPSTPAYGYSYRYRLPADCLRPVLAGDHYAPLGIMGVHYSYNRNTAPRAPWEVFGEFLETDQSAPLDFEYVRRVTEVTLFASTFAEALASALAVECCEALTGSAGKVDRALRDYDRAISMAAMVNALYRPPRPRQAGTWIRARHSHG